MSRNSFIGAKHVFAFPAGPNIQQNSPRSEEFRRIKAAAAGKPPAFQVGQWVVTKKGDLGMINAPRGIGYVIQFGASGPTHYFSGRELRWATLQEVTDSGKLGIGYTPSPECP
jgi:hypothetical protein